MLELDSEEKGLGPLTLAPSPILILLGDEGEDRSPWDEPEACLTSCWCNESLRTGSMNSTGEACCSISEDLLPGWGRLL